MASTQLFQVLGACLSPDPAARKAAEATLAQVCGEREGERRGSVRSSARARLS